MYRRPFHDSSKNWLSSFSCGRFAVYYKIKPYKNTTDNKLKKTFSWLKNSVHVELSWFSSDNLTLCDRSNYSSMVLHAIEENFRPVSNVLLLPCKLARSAVARLQHDTSTTSIRDKSSWHTCLERLLLSNIYFIYYFIPFKRHKSPHPLNQCCLK